MPASHDPPSLARSVSHDVPEQLSGSILEANRCSGAVVIVDESAENREVLSTALQRRGMTTFEADEPGYGLQLVRRHQPDVVVLDLDFHSPVRDSAAVGWPEDYLCETAATNGSLVLLGRWQAGSRQVPREQIIAKPYHFGPLIRKIEELVEQHRLPQGTATHGLVVRDSRT